MCTTPDDFLLLLGDSDDQYEDEGNDVDLDKSKVKLKLAPALGTSGVWSLGRHHAGDQGHLGDREVLDLLGLVKSTSLIGGRAFYMVNNIFTCEDLVVGPIFGEIEAAGLRRFEGFRD